MDRKIAQAALQFLQRVQLTGHEVPAFLAVVHALEAYAVKRDDVAALQKRFDATVDRRDTPSGAPAPILDEAQHG